MKKVSVQTGFTLVEVLVALVIVALVLGAGFRATGLLTTTQESLRLSTLAGWSADNRLADLRLARMPLTIGTGEAPCPQADAALLCLLTVTASPNTFMRRVDVRVVLASERDHTLAHRMAFMPVQP